LKNSNTKERKSEYAEGDSEIREIARKADYDYHGKRALLRQKSSIKRRIYPGSVCGKDKQDIFDIIFRKERRRK